MTTIDTKSEAKPSSTEVRVLRAATCPSLSGKSKLTYELGCDDKAGLQLRIAKNSGTGYFSTSWVVRPEQLVLTQALAGGAH